MGPPLGSGRSRAAPQCSTTRNESQEPETANARLAATPGRSESHQTQQQERGVKRGVGTVGFFSHNSQVGLRGVTGTVEYYISSPQQRHVHRSPERLHMKTQIHRASGLALLLLFAATGTAIAQDVAVKETATIRPFRLNLTLGSFSEGTMRVGAFRAIMTKPAVA